MNKMSRQKVVVTTILLLSLSLSPFLSPITKALTVTQNSMVVQNATVMQNPQNSQNPPPPTPLNDTFSS